MPVSSTYKLTLPRNPLVPQFDVAIDLNDSLRPNEARRIRIEAGLDAEHPFIDGWLMRYRRLVRDYERRPDHHEAMVLWATVVIMTRQLARNTAGAPPHPRWADPAP